MITALTGTGSLTRLAVRRDRAGLPASVYVIVALVASTAYSLKKLYPTPASRSKLAVTAEASPALRFLYGRLDGTSLGSITTWRYGVWAALFAVLMTIFVVIRHTRADEEAGRGELVGSAAVGRQAGLTAALLVAGTANVLIAVLACVVLPFTGLTAAGSVALAWSIGLCGLAFTGITALAAQVVSGARAARGIALGVLGVAFMLRGVGDAAGSGALSSLTWASPLGWVSLARPFGSVRWWVLALPAVVFVVAAGAAFVLASRRDVGAGLFADRPGRASASSFLRDPFGLAWRLQWGTLAGYAGGYVVLFAVCGAAAKGIGQLLGTSSALEREFTRLGGQAAIVNAYLAALMLLAGLVATGYATGAVLRLHTEEAGERAEPVLATAVGRLRWGLSHVLIAVAGAAVLMAAAGVATALGYVVAAGSSNVAAGPEVAHLLGAGLAQLPAVLAVAGVAVLAFGLRSSWSVPAGWTAVGVAAVVALFGQALQLPQWLLDVSPFTHTPRLPGGPVHAAPLLWLALAALALGIAGLAALHRRDIA